MSFKSILVHSDDSAPGKARLDTAIALCRRFDAHLTALCLGIEPSMAAMGFVHANPAVGMFMEEVNAASQEAERLAGIAGRKIEAEGISGEARPLSSTIDGMAPLCARQALYHDLAIIGQPSQEEVGPLAEQVLQGVLFDTATAVIVHPSQEIAEPGSRIMIAWDGRPEAAAAIHRAMPMLESAEAVTLAIVDPRVGSDAHGEEPGADIAVMLARHDIEVSVERLASSGRSIAQALADHANDWSADLVVMGAYGHSRLREFVLGGTTRDLLNGATLPLLVAH